jgi:ubiquinone/menaquinone biosynthesis C-methylase UbiE
MHKNQSMNALEKQLNTLIASYEAADPEFLQSLFTFNPDFKAYQYALASLQQSVYNNIVLRYRHLERTKLLLDETGNNNYVLEVGCGYGDLSLELSKNGKKMAMLDISPLFLRTAKLRIKKFNLNIDVICADAHNLPFKDKCFDVVYSSQVIEHVKQPSKFLIEELRVARSKVILICTNNFQTKALPFITYIYYRSLKCTVTEDIPDLGGYDEIRYLNCQMFPINSIFPIVIMRRVIQIPIINKIVAGNVAKIYHKKLNQSDEIGASK